MKSLFLKIFLTFWLAQALFLVLAILTTLALSPARRGNVVGGGQILAESVNAFQTGGTPATRQYLEQVMRDRHFRTFVFDPAGRELSGQSVPPWVEDLRQGNKPRNFPRHTNWIDKLLPARLQRMALTLDGKRYTLVVLLPPGPQLFVSPQDIPGLGIAIAVLTSGLMCFLLARSVTRPVARLRSAAQSLTAGDLSARTGPPPDGRRDELTELMRDFDRMADRIEGLVESQSRLLKDVSHELRSPLARLSVALGLARQRAAADAAPELTGSFDRIELEADRLNQLIQRLLTISRLESGTDGLTPTRFSLRQLVQQVAHDAEYEANGKPCRVQAPGDPQDDFSVEADPDLLRSAIENVVRNAVRYTADGTVVEVRLARQMEAGTGMFLVRVLDSGPGVPREALGKIFEPFYRIDDARNRQTGGAGLGLSIAQRAIRLHGGQVRASNRQEGGLEVEIRIPVGSAFALPAHS